MLLPLRYHTPIVHRIIEINSDGTFQTKGDANNGQLSFEKSIHPEQIHGKEIAIVPYLGWVKIAMNEYIMPNLLWIAAFAAIYILYSEVLSTKVRRWW